MIGVTAFVATLFEEFNAPAKAKLFSEKEGNKYYNIPVPRILELWKIEAEKGTHAHFLIEEYYTSDLEEPLWFHSFVTSNPEYSKEKVLGVEIPLVSREYNIRGVCDAVFERDGDTYEIVDWKRTSGIFRTSSENQKSIHPLLDDIIDTNYWHYTIQLAVYGVFFEEEVQKKVSKLTIVHINSADENIITTYDIPIDYMERIKEVLKSRTLECKV